MIRGRYVLCHVQNLKRSRTVLGPEAKSYVEAGATSEVQFYRAVPEEGATVKDLQAWTPPSPLSLLLGLHT